MSSKAQQKKEKKEAEIQKIIQNEQISDLDKIKKLIGNNGDQINPPYYSKNNIIECFEETDRENKDMLFWSPKDKKFLDKYTPVNNQHFLKILIYASIYKISFNFNFLKNDIIVTQIRKLVRNVFKNFILSTFERSVFVNHNVYTLVKVLENNFNFIIYSGHYTQSEYTERKKISTKHQELYTNSYDDAVRYTLLYYLNLHPQLKKYLKYDKIYNIDYRENSIEKQIKYDSLSNSIDKNPCKIKYEILERYKSMKTIAKDMIKSCNTYNISEAEIQKEKLSLPIIKKMINDDIINKLIKDKRYSQIKDNNFTFSLDIDIRTPLKSLFEEYIQNYEFMNILTLPLDNLVINKKTGDDIILHAQDVGGVRKDIFNDITKELFQKQIFIKPDVNFLESDRYFLNPKFNLENLGKEYKRVDDTCAKSSRSSKSLNSTQNVKYDEATTNEFYTFIGDLIIFLWINNFKLPYKLSSFLLSGFIRKNYKKKGSITIPTIKDYDLIYYMIRDFKNAYDILIKPLQVQDENHNTFFSSIEMNTITSLTKKYEDIELNIENYEKYLKNLSSYIYTFNPIKDDDTNRMDVLHICFFDAFDNNRRRIDILNAYEIHLSTIDEDLANSPFTEEIIKVFVDNIYILRDNEAKNDDALGMNIKANLYEDIINNIDKKYISKLLKFWSGTDDYNKNEKYFINIKSNIRSNLLPVSHTCFNTIDIPIYNDHNVFFKNLKKSIDHTYESDMAGGNKRKQKKKSKKNKVI